MVIGFGFVVILGNLVYLQVFRGEDLAGNPRNPRALVLEEETLVGGINDRNGEILARTTIMNGRPQRQYPWGDTVAHVVGYRSSNHGRSGLEAAYNPYLLGLKGRERLLNSLRRLAGLPPQGDTLTLTLDVKLQRMAMDLLAGRPGAAVVLDPRNGQVLALASSPAFDPMNPGLALENSQQAAFLNRALQGNYPPGSTIKLLTAGAALELDAAFGERTYNCPGYLVVEGRRLKCIAVHGEITLSNAIALSCNVTLATVALEAGSENWVKTARRLGFESVLPFDLAAEGGRLKDKGAWSANALTEASIGQGPVTASPLQMALLAAGVANAGSLMRPYLVSQISTFAGEVVFQAKPQVMSRVFEQTTIAYLKDAMVKGVEYGTGVGAALDGITVAGKTGSAENPSGPPHAWFIGFAPAEAPQVAVAVIVENGGAGGIVAAPIARELIGAVLQGV